MRFPVRNSIILLIIVGIIVVSPSVFSFSGEKKACVRQDKLHAEKINLPGMDNLYKLSDSVYRSEQPGSNEMKELEKYGIRTVLNLRNYHSDDDEAEGTRLVLERIPMKAGKVSYDHILKAMQILRDSPKPVLIHCLHGSDRTGCMVASYRIVFQNWTKEDAIKELRNPAFGYHETWFPNISETIRLMDVDKLRKDLGLKR